MTDSQQKQCLPFFAAIHEDVTNYLHREIFADWLDDHGLWREALGQRWLARNKREIELPRNGLLLSGWFSEGNDRHPKSSLAEIFCPWIGSRGLTDIIAPLDPIKAELAFMKRCTELMWDQSGEPISELQLE